MLRVISIAFVEFAIIFVPFQALFSDMVKIEST